MDLAIIILCSDNPALDLIINASHRSFAVPPMHFLYLHF